MVERAARPVGGQASPRLPHGAFTPFVVDFAAELRRDADQLTERGAADTGKTLEWVAEQLETKYRAYAWAWLTVGEAATASGYSEAHVRDLVRAGRLAHQRSGPHGHIRIRRCDVPLKLATPDSSALDAVAKGLGIR